MATLIIQCPNRPVIVRPEDWSTEALYFSWGFADDIALATVLDLEACPVADEVIALLPGIDVRLIELQIPAVSAKKINQLLPVLLEDELLSTVSGNLIQLLPPMSDQMPDRRMVGVVDRDWLLWLSKKLAVINCERIKLIPDCMLLPSGQHTIYFEQKGDEIFYTFKKSPKDIVCWSQRALEKTIPLQDSDQKPDLQELSTSLIKLGLGSEKKVYQYVNLLPDEFAAFRKSNNSELQHWFSQALWKPPLRWLGGLGITLSACYLGYLGFLLWQDFQWQKVIQEATDQILVRENIDQPSFPLLVASSCFAAHKNHETCEGDFERMLIALQDVLQSVPPGLLKSIEYSKNGLAFELQDSVFSADQQLDSSNKQSVESISPSHYLLKPYANLGHE